MKGEIISIGTELLLGQIVNSNAQFISEQMAMLGIPVYYHSVVGDNPDRLHSQLQISSARSDVLIFTGGLGPTKDDLTKDTIAHFLGRSIIMNQDALDQILKLFQGRNSHMTENNRRQAHVIEGSRVFPNETGLAPGMAVHAGNRHYLLFPGPPRELQPMFLHQGIPYLQEISPQKKVVHSKVMKFCGIGESLLETKLMDLIDGQMNPTIAPLAKEGEVTLRLTSYSDSIAEAENVMQETIHEVRSRVGEYLYGWDDDSLEDVIIEYLLDKGLSISTAESCTGGLVSHFICRGTGASKVFRGGTICYTNQVKNQELGVPEDVLAAHGAVSAKTAEYLAQGTREKYQADIGLSITGVAGPATQEGKPVGRVYIGIAFPTHTTVKELQLSGGREQIQQRATNLALFHTLKECQKKTE